LRISPKAIRENGDARGSGFCVARGGGRAERCHPRTADGKFRNSGLDRWIAPAISIDKVRAYKPHQYCYALVEPALGVTKEEVLFVSSNSFDVVGAKAFGFRVAWIRRSVSNPGTMFAMLRGRAEELGHGPDHIVSALTNLPEVLGG